MRFVFFSFSLLVRNKNNKCTSKTSNKVLRIKLRVCVEFNHKAISDFFCAYCCCRCCYSILSPSFLFFRCFFCNRSVAPNVVSLFNFDFTQTFFLLSSAFRMVQWILDGWKTIRFAHKITPPSVPTNRLCDYFLFFQNI